MRIHSRVNDERNRPIGPEGFPAPVVRLARARPSNHLQALAKVAGGLVERAVLGAGRGRDDDDEAVELGGGGGGAGGPGPAEARLPRPRGAGAARALLLALLLASGAAAGNRTLVLAAFRDWRLHIRRLLGQFKKLIMIRYVGIGPECKISIFISCYFCFRLVPKLQ